MTNLTSTFDLVVRDVVLQSTVVFLVALVISRFAVRRPARVHTVLTLAFVAAIVAPIASEGVRRAGWGLLPPETSTPQPSAVASVNSPSMNPPPEQRASVDLPGPSEAVPQMADRASPANQFHDGVNAASQTATPAPKVALETSAPGGSVLSRETLLTMGLIAWLCASAYLIWRLLVGVIGAGRVLRSATPCHEPTVAAALIAARDRLQMNDVNVEVFESSLVRCPMIWCWGRQPKLLLPVETARNWSAATWTPVLCHELAHWKRRDHWAALVAEVVCCLMPWQVLGWWAKRRLEHASEQACDDWTVAVGHSAVDYAETLLGLVAQADPPLALAALRRRSGLPGRIQHLLNQAVPHPRLGRLWTAAVLSLALIGIGVTGVCQRGIARAESEAEPLETGAATETHIKPTSHGQAAHTVFGRIVGPDGKPMSEVEVTWEGVTRPTPRGIDDWPGVFRERFARVKTDTDGRFRCEATFAEAAYSFTSLLIRSERYGLRARHVNMKTLGDPIEVSLEETYPIEGTILTSLGEPVAGARVLIRRLHRYDAADPDEANWSRGLDEQEHKSRNYPEYWPAPVTTDANGRFRIEDIVPRSGACQVEILCDDYPPTVVHVAGKDSKRDPSWEYIDAPFTLVLEEPLTVHGQFTDEKTGAAIAGVKIDVMQMGRRGGSTLDRVEATSDAEGRYTLRLGSADSYWTRVFPPSGYAGVTHSIDSKEIEKLTVKPLQLDYPVKLRPGKIVRGRVVVEGTNEPVAGVEVVYQGARNRKFGVNSHFLPVKTGEDGSFELVGADGKGFLLVEAPNRGFYRVHTGEDRLRNPDGFFAHGFIAIDVPTDGDAGDTYTIPLHRGPVLIARVVDPGGKPATKLVSMHAEQTFDGVFRSELCLDGEFRIDAARPGQMYRVFLYSSDAKAGKVVELIAPADGQPLQIKLEPCATIRGRYVYKDGTGVPEITNFSHFRIDPAKGPEEGRIDRLPFYDNFTQDWPKQRVTDSEGNFVLDNIVPGAFMHLQVNYQFADGKPSYEVGILKPGEIRDVGELVIHAK